MYEVDDSQDDTRDTSGALDEAGVTEETFSPRGHTAINRGARITTKRKNTQIVNKKAEPTASNANTQSTVASESC